MDVPLAAASGLRYELHPPMGSTLTRGGALLGVPLHSVRAAACTSPRWRRSGLPGRSGAASCRSTTGPGPRSTLPRRPAHDLRRVPTSMPPRARRPSRRGRGRTTWNSTRSSQDRCPAVPRSPLIVTTRRARDETAVTGRTGEHHTAGRRTGGHESAGQPRPDEGARWPDSGRLDTGRLDTWAGRRAGLGGHPSSGHSLAMDSRQASWHPTTATRTLPLGCCPGAPPGRRRVGRSAVRTAQQEKILPGAGHRRARQVWVALRRPVGASAHCCPRRISVEGRAGWWLPSGTWWRVEGELWVL
jgi:hypothetical protein